MAQLSLTLTLHVLGLVRYFMPFGTQGNKLVVAVVARGVEEDG